MNIRYFSEIMLSHLKPHQGLSERYHRRAIDVALAAKLTMTYGKYHLVMLHRQLAMSECRRALCAKRGGGVLQEGV